MAIGNDRKENIVSTFKSLIDEDFTREILRDEIADSVLIEDREYLQVQSNGDLYSRIRQILHDAGLDTKSHAGSLNEHL